MQGILDTVALAGVVAVAACVTALLLRPAGPRTGRGDLLRVGGAAALSAVVAAVVSLIEVRVDSTVSLAVANMTLVSTAGLVWAAVRAVNGRAQAGVVPASAVALGVFVFTFLSESRGSGLKLAALVAFGALAAVEARRRPMRALPGAGAVAIAGLGYSVYCAGRLATALVLGVDSSVYRMLFSQAAMTLVSMVAIVVLIVAVFCLARALDDVPVPASRSDAAAQARDDAHALLAESGPLVAFTVSPADADLIRTAYGTERMDAIAAAIAQAVRLSLPPGAIVLESTRSTIVGLAPAGPDHGEVDHAIRERFASASPRIGYEAIPDLRIVHRGIADVAHLRATVGRSNVRGRIPLRRPAPHARGL